MSSRIVRPGRNRRDFLKAAVALGLLPRSFAQTGAVKPPLGTPVNQRHPLAQGLVSAFLFNNSYADYCGSPYSGPAQSFVTLGPDGNAVVAPGDDGYGDGNGGLPNPSAIYYASPMPATVGTPLTIMARGFLATTATNCEGCNEFTLVSFGADNSVSGDRSGYGYIGFGITTQYYGTGVSGLFLSQEGDHVTGPVTSEIQNFPLGQWTTMGVSLDGARSNSIATFFKDGVFESQPGYGSSPLLIDPTYGVSVGSGIWNHGDGGVTWTPGYFSWVLIWLRALSQAEMLSVYANPFQMIGGGPGALRTSVRI